MSFGRRALLAAGGASVLAGCSGPAALNALVPRNTYDLHEGISYGNDARQRLDIYVPRVQAAARSVVLFFYGGSWTRGSRGDYRFVGESLASAGIVTVVADYRLSPQVHWRGVLEDCAGAARWTFDAAPRFGASRERVFLMGHSAGAYNAAMLALDPRWLEAQRLAPTALAGWIGVAGPYNFLPIADPDTQRAFDWPDTPVSSQPVAHVSRAAPRSLLLAARHDAVVDPERNSSVLAQRLQRAGAPVRLELLQGVNHVTVIAALARPLRLLAPVRDEVTRFLLA